MRLRAAFPVLLLLACLGVYSNNYGHEPLFDSVHLIRDNPAIHSLAKVPSYFTRPETFSQYRSNVDYRPILLVSYALNHWMGGETGWPWHFTQILLHFTCALFLYLVCRRVLSLAYPEEDPRAAEGIAMAAALVFALHPTASGVVNYLSARSSLLTAAFLLPSIFLYMRPFRDERYGRPAGSVALLFALALLTKVEAIGCLGVYLAYEVWRQAATRSGGAGFFTCLLHAFNRTTLRRMGPVLGVVALYLPIRHVLMAPFPFSEARHDASVTWHDYLFTQLVVWWEYVAHWFFPVGLVADNLVHPVYRSLLAPPVAAAAVGWGVVLAVLLRGWKRRPYLVFLALSALALLSPTSSVLPLVEMLNEHRPYLPLALLSLCWIIPLGRALASGTAGGRAPLRVAAVGLVGVTLLTLGVMTYARNRVFRDAESYWTDVTNKAPSYRSLGNLGVIAMGRGAYRDAIGYFEQSLTQAPESYATHINLAISYHNLGDDDRALQHYNWAVVSDPFTGRALSWRGEFQLLKGNYRAALADFQASLNRKSVQTYRNHKGMATAFAGLGMVGESHAATLRCLRADPDRVAAELDDIVKPYLTGDDRLAEAGVAYLTRLMPALPDAWRLYQNLGVLAERLGRTELAKSSYARARALRG